jgi:hypothetical protein
VPSGNYFSFSNSQEMLQNHSNVSSYERKNSEAFSKTYVDDQVGENILWRKQSDDKDVRFGVESKRENDDGPRVVEEVEDLEAIERAKKEKEAKERDEVGSRIALLKAKKAAAEEEKAKKAAAEEEKARASAQFASSSVTTNSSGGSHG